MKVPRFLWRQRHKACLLKMTLAAVSAVSSLFLFLSVLRGSVISKQGQTRIRLLGPEDALMRLQALPAGLNKSSLIPPHLPQPILHPPEEPRPPQQPKEQQQQQQQERQAQGLSSNSLELRISVERMQQRRAVAEKFCSQRKTNTSSSPARSRGRKSCPIRSLRHHSEFCPIAKIGSTFWTRFYKVLRISSSSDALDSPYKVPLSAVDSERCDHRTVNVSRQTVKVVFVRDPFSRIFSAYVDKLVSPNPIFWHKWGKPSMALDGLDRQSLRCGEAVTFKQFFRFVTKRLHSVDNHIIPMSELCDPCQTPFDLIGNMETFPDDLHYMMSLLNVSFRPEVQLSRETKQDAIFDSVQGPFTWMKKTKLCISTQEIGRRIWRKLQLRGLISSRIQYPLGSADISNMTIAQFYHVALDAHQKSTDARELSHLKKQAFAEAYRSVPRQDLLEFVYVYRNDFRAFGYEMFPVSIFGEDARFTGGR